MIAGMIMLEMNCALEAGVEQLVVLRAEPLLDLAAPAEHLDQRVAGERLLDLAVERADVLPLRDEALLRALARSSR